jgi:hypothetical protein
MEAVAVVDLPGVLVKSGQGQEDFAAVLAADERLALMAGLPRIIFAGLAPGLLALIVTLKESILRRANTRTYPTESVMAMFAALVSASDATFQPPGDVRQ